MKAIKCQLKMKCDMPGQTIQGLLEYVYSQPIIAGHPKQVSVRNHFTKFCLLDSSGSQSWDTYRQNGYEMSQTGVIGGPEGVLGRGGGTPYVFGVLGDHIFAAAFCLYIR